MKDKKKSLRILRSEEEQQDNTPSKMQQQLICSMKTYLKLRANLLTIRMLACFL